MKTSSLLSIVLFFCLFGTFDESSATEERAVTLNGVLNTRDLGGLKTEDGRTVRTGQLIRSGKIDGIDAAGMEHLNSMGVTVVVDLRTTKEATQDPALWPEGQGPTRYNFPLMERETGIIDDMHMKIESGTAKGGEIDKLFHDAFGYIGTDYTAEIRELLDVLLSQPEGEAVLYHCSGGKDRTGISTAIILTALGVKQEDIEADFMMSNLLSDADNAAVELAAKVNAAQGTNMTAETVWPSVGVREVYLDEFYRSVEEKYGSMDRYLHEGLKLTDGEMQALRARYLN